MKLSDLDLDIPSTQSDVIKGTLIRGSVKNDRGKRQPHPAGVYFYKSVPSFEGIAIIDYKTMEKYDYQKIDILNNTFLDNMTAEELNSYIESIVLKNFIFNIKSLYHEICSEINFSNDVEPIIYNVVKNKSDEYNIILNKKN